MTFITEKITRIAATTMATSWLLEIYEYGVFGETENGVWKIKNDKIEVIESITASGDGSRKFRATTRRGSQRATLVRCEETNGNHSNYIQSRPNYDWKNSRLTRDHARTRNTQKVSTEASRYVFSNLVCDK